MIIVIISFLICHHLISYLSWPIRQCMSLKDWRLQWARGLEPNAPRSDRIFADDTLMPNKYCPMPVLAPDKETALLFKFKNCFCGRDTCLSTVTTSTRPTDFLCRRTFWLRQNELVGPEWPFWCLDIDWTDVRNKFNSLGLVLTEKSSEEKVKKERSFEEWWKRNADLETKAGIEFAIRSVFCRSRDIGTETGWQ